MQVFPLTKGTHQRIGGRNYKLPATLIRFCARASTASARGQFKSGASAADCSLTRSNVFSTPDTSISDDPALQLVYEILTTINLKEILALLRDRNYGLRDLIQHV